MEYKDERIAELKKLRRINKYTDIKGEGVFIHDRFITFCLRSINDSTKLYLPEEFIDMPEEIKKMKYPSINRPQILITSLDSTINFAFSMIQQQMSADQIESLTDQMKELIHKANPSAVFYQEDSACLANGQPICMFDFKSYSIDEQIYNMVCFTPLSRGTLHGTFTCLDQDAEDWEVIAWEAFKTIKEVKTGE